MRLEGVRGTTWFDGLEVSALKMMDILKGLRRQRTYRHLKDHERVGWAAVRVRDLTRGGYKEQVGLRFARDVPYIEGGLGLATPVR